MARQPTMVTRGGGSKSDSAKSLLDCSKRTAFIVLKAVRFSSHVIYKSSCFWWFIWEGVLGDEIKVKNCGL
jgi:hypothetical protein